MRAKRKPRQKAKSFSDMNTTELEKATAEFDEEFVVDASSPLTKQQRAKWSKAKRKRGRPKIGQGVRVISVSIEKRLLDKTDRLAKRLKVKRAKLISRGLKAILDEEIPVEV